MKKISYTLSALALVLLVACGNDEPKPSGKVEPSSETPGTTSSDASPAHTNKAVTDAEYDDGLKLIATSDCLTCHKLDTKLIGPAYQDVANKYDYTPDNVSLLAGRIINGSKDVWSPVPMQAHPNLSKEDAEKMVKYVFAFKK